MGGYFYLKFNQNIDEGEYEELEETEEMILIEEQESFHS